MMRQAHYGILSAFLIAATLSTRPHAAGAEFRLLVTGSHLLAFAGDCLLIDAGGFEVWAELNGAVPQAYLLPAEAAACEIRNEDRDGVLTVRLEGEDETLAEASTRAGFGEVSVRSDGPWGPRSATVTVHPGFPIPGFPLPHGHGLSFPRSPIVPPLRGQTVPPLR
jgi:hypothetical protein